MTPRVTVLMPVYNAAAHLQQAIDSILNQTFADFEFLIINDGSTDSSDKIIRSYTDARIVYVANEVNLKLIATLNKGIELARGEYIVRMDADDISLPPRIEKLLAFMDSTPNVGVCGSWFESFGGKSKVTKYQSESDAIRLHMLHQCHLCHPSVILRKKVLLTNKLFYNKEYIHAEDYELWVRMGAYTKYANIPEVLLRYRQHEDSVSNKYSDIQLENLKKISKMAFRQLGIDINDEQLKLYNKLVYADFSCSNADLIELSQIIGQMVEANKRSMFVEQSFLGYYLASRWEHMLYNAPVGGMLMRKLYFYPPLAGYMNNKAKAILKSIFK
jgi:glycosyltransferase involved in cell wall biosynthesis